jgi:hypothetical protein
MVELCNMHPNYIFGTDSARKSFLKRPQNLRKLYNSPQLNKQVLGQLDWFFAISGSATGLEGDGLNWTNGARKGGSTGGGPNAAPGQ